MISVPMSLSPERVGAPLWENMFTNNKPKNNGCVLSGETNQKINEGRGRGPFRGPGGCHPLSLSLLFCKKTLFRSYLESKEQGSREHLGEKGG